MQVTPNSILKVSQIHQRSKTWLIGLNASPSREICGFVDFALTDRVAIDWADDFPVMDTF